MSESQEVSAVEAEVTKKTDLVFYLNTDGEETRRQFAQRVDDNKDYFDTRDREYTNSTYFIVANGERHELGEDTYNGLRGANLGDANLHETEEKKVDDSWRHQPKTPLKELAGDVIRRAFEEADDAPGGWAMSPYLTRIDDASGDTKLRVRTSFERIPMLRHKDEIEPDDMYEDEDEDYLAFKLKIIARKLPGDELEWVDDEGDDETDTEETGNDSSSQTETTDTEVNNADA